MFPVGGAQGSFMFQLAQALVDLNIAEWVAAVPTDAPALFPPFVLDIR